MDIVPASTETDGTIEGRGKNAVFTDMQTNKKRIGLLDQSEQLFPRLPDEITLSRIVPKLPWRAFHILAPVSRTWRKAIQNHRVNDARIHSCSTDTLVVHDHSHLKQKSYYLTNCSVMRVAVYSTRDKLCYDLPLIPGHHRGLPTSCQYVSLDGKIYVIGGALRVFNPDDSSRCCSFESSSKVYVLDLAGASHWKECASMERGRWSFGCGVIHGKIFVFGGTHGHGPVRGAEVYDPKVNAWSPIMPMTSLRFNHNVLTLAEKLVVHGGNCYPSYNTWTGYMQLDPSGNGGHGGDCYDPSYNNWKANLQLDPSGNGGPAVYYRRPEQYPASFLEVYHPVEDEWTWDEPLSDPDEDTFYSGSVFVVRGQLHLMTEIGVYVHDDHADNRSWKLLHSNEFPPTRDIGPIGSVEEMSVLAIATVVLNDELLAAVMWQGESETSDGSALLQSKGFGTKDKTLVWKVVSKCPGGFADFMCCIQL